jgi:phage-related protein
MVRDLEWVGSSLDDLRQFPNAVQRTVGFALYLAQMGDKHVDARPLKGYRGAGVLEVITNFDGDTYRTIYTVRLSDAVYVLHAFQKKSPRGSEVPRKDLDLITSRLKLAPETSARRLGQRSQ